MRKGQKVEEIKYCVVGFNFRVQFPCSALLSLFFPRFLNNQPEGKCFGGTPKLGGFEYLEDLEAYE